MENKTFILVCLLGIATTSAVFAGNGTADKRERQLNDPNVPIVCESGGGRSTCQTLDEYNRKKAAAENERKKRDRIVKSAEKKLKKLLEEGKTVKVDTDLAKEIIRKSKDPAFKKLSKYVGRKLTTKFVVMNIKAVDSALNKGVGGYIRKDRPKMLEILIQADKNGGRGSTFLNDYAKASKNKARR